jgi:hypothetical protein
MQEDQSAPVTILYDLIEPRSETEAKVVRGIFGLEHKAKILTQREDSGASEEGQERKRKKVVEKKAAAIINYADPIRSSLLEIQLLSSGEIKVLPVTKCSFQEEGVVLYKHGNRIEECTGSRGNLRVPLYFPYHATFIDENGQQEEAIAQFIPWEIRSIAIKPRRLPPLPGPVPQPGFWNEPKREWGPKRLPPIKR